MKRASRFEDVIVVEVIEVVENTTEVDEVTTTSDYSPLRVINIATEVKMFIEKVRKMNLDYNDDYYRDTYHALYKEAEELMDYYCYKEGKEFVAVYKMVSEAYWNLCALDEDMYYDYCIEDFREFEKHKGEPDFDWDFYSDWHKDIFGYRPRS